MSKTSIYACLFGRLNGLIPGFQTIAAGDVFSARPRIKGEMTVFCHVAETEGNLFLIELAGDRTNSAADLPSPWIRLRVDMANKLAEVLEMEDAFGYQVVYAGAQAVNSRRDQINLFAMNWLQVLVQFDRVSSPAAEPLAA